MIRNSQSNLHDLVMCNFLANFPLTYHEFVCRFLFYDKNQFHHQAKHSIAQISLHLFVMDTNIVRSLLRCLRLFDVILKV